VYQNTSQVNFVPDLYLDASCRVENVLVVFWGHTANNYDGKNAPLPGWSGGGGPGQRLVEGGYREVGALAPLFTRVDEGKSKCLAASIFANKRLFHVLIHQQLITAGLAVSVAPAFMGAHFTNALQIEFGEENTLGLPGLDH
jgi:hypothetical protein